jgi:hypothetical protein
MSLKAFAGHRGGPLRAKGCWTFDARDRMPRLSPLTAHPLTATAKKCTRLDGTIRYAHEDRIAGVSDHSPLINPGRGTEGSNPLPLWLTLGFLRLS